MSYTNTACSKQASNVSWLSNKKHTLCTSSARLIEQAWSKQRETVAYKSSCCCVASKRANRCAYTLLLLYIQSSRRPTCYFCFPPPLMIYDSIKSHVYEIHRSAPLARTVANSLLYSGTSNLAFLIYIEICLLFY